MGDDSPGKVQALRAIFAEKNKPVMGMMPPGGKHSSRPWRNANSLDEKFALKERSPNEQIIPTQTMTKVLPYPVKITDLNAAKNNDVQNGINGVCDRTHSKIPPKPNIGPKPTKNLWQQGRTNSSSALNSVASDGSDKSNSNESLRDRTFSDSQGFQKSQVKTKGMGETIASFMFSNGDGKVSAGASNSVESNDIFHQPPVPTPRTSQIRPANFPNQDLVNVCNNSQNNGMPPKRDFGDACSNLITSDNYICNSYFRRKDLPTKEKLGSAPLKPIKPPHLKLPSKKYFATEPNDPPPVLSTTFSTANTAPALPQKPTIQRPPYPCPPRPLTSPPLPPTFSAPVIKPPEQQHAGNSPASLRDEIEELYEDTLLHDIHDRPVSLIPEYTEEEEQAAMDLEELYNDAGEEVPILPISPCPMKPKDPPPPRPSEYLQPNFRNGSVDTEELYQDALEPYQEEFYEEMPVDLTPEEPGAPLYSNNRKELEKLRREEEKRLRKEQKEKEKKEKELEKMKRKFGLTGEEIPIDAGLVKLDCRGGKSDLPVRKGETVLILRMEGNPSGRWLVKNEKGKIGYVELTNIEVMTIRRLSVISASEELYSEAMSEEEGIYEVTY